jgi:FlaA1/EpsC-like NDP-sugar epimerase
VFTGLRPGEKLFEELVGTDEHAEPSGVEKVLRVRPLMPARHSQLGAQITELERVAVDGDAAATLLQLAHIVPAFRSSPSPAESTAPSSSEAIAALK